MGTPGIRNWDGSTWNRNGNAGIELRAEIEMGNPGSEVGTQQLGTPGNGMGTAEVRQQWQEVKRGSRNQDGNARIELSAQKLRWIPQEVRWESRNWDGNTEIELQEVRWEPRNWDWKLGIQIETLELGWEPKNWDEKSLGHNEACPASIQQQQLQEGHKALRFWGMGRAPLALRF